MVTNEISEFYYLFSRSEYALKASGFLMNVTDAKANWDSFAREICSEFNQNKCKELSDAVEYIKSHPPKKQIVKNGNLSWNQTDNNDLPLVNFLILMIRRIRNNLFHGGKIQSGYTSDVARDLKLIDSAKIILNEIITLNDKVKFYYKQPIAK